MKTLPCPRNQQYLFSKMGEKERWTKSCLKLFWKFICLFVKQKLPYGTILWQGICKYYLFLQRCLSEYLFCQPISLICQTHQNKFTCFTVLLFCCAFVSSNRSSLRDDAPPQAFVFSSSDFEHWSIHANKHIFFLINEYTFSSWQIDVNWFRLILIVPRAVMFSFGEIFV